MSFHGDNNNGHYNWFYCLISPYERPTKTPKYRWVPTAARFLRAVAYTSTPFALRMGFRRAASVSVLRIASET
ncbi:hypothetical protein [Providencia rettgeri]|uniref:hypothetical protein n=1 Tax=Providencia rettgeri TaxID=587 RepID=UPI0030160F26